MLKIVEMRRHSLDKGVPGGKKVSLLSWSGENIHARGGCFVAWIWSQKSAGIVRAIGAKKGRETFLGTGGGQNALRGLKKKKDLPQFMQ